MKVSVNPKRIFISLLSIIGVLLLANIIGVIAKLNFESHSVRLFVKIFDFDTEGNIPSFYSAVALIFSSGLLFMIALAHKKRNSPYLLWLGLGFVFLFLSIDEISSIHEKIGQLVKAILKEPGFASNLKPNHFYAWLIAYAWLVPYGFGLMVFVLVYSKFLLGLPRHIMYLLVASGVIFVTGALGFELIGGPHYSSQGLAYSICYACEESLEMIGIAMFIYSLLKYIVYKFNSFSMTITNDQF